MKGANQPFYSKSCAIIQSSGMGKSRLIAEIGNDLPTYYSCCRMPEEGYGFPEETPGLMGYLTEPISLPEHGPSSASETESSSRVGRHALETCYYDVIMYSRCVSIVLACFVLSTKHWEFFNDGYRLILYF